MERLCADFADAREFVAGIGALDARACDRGVFVGSGASSAPTITYALIGAVAHEFGAIDELDLALSPGNQNPRGAATIGAVLGILGEPIDVWIDGAWRERHSPMESSADSRLKCGAMRVGPVW